MVRGPELVGPHSDLAHTRYTSVRPSAQAAYYQSSDWGLCAVVVAALDRFNETGEASVLHAAQTLMGPLLIGEGDDRRRVNLRVEPCERPDATTTGDELAALRRRLDEQSGTGG